MPEPIDYRARCISMHTALTSRDGTWPVKDPGLHAGTIAAFEQLEDCFRIYLRDMDAAERPGRIWAQGDAHYLMHDLCAAVAKCHLYGSGERVRYFATMLEGMQRPHRLYHDRQGDQHYLSCVLHGRQFSVSAQHAEVRHAAGEPCPRCEANVERNGYRL